MEEEIIDTGIKDNVMGYFFCIGLLEKLFKDGVITEEIVKRGTNYYKKFYKVTERDIMFL